MTVFPIVEEVFVVPTTSFSEEQRILMAETLTRSIESEIQGFWDTLARQQAMIEEEAARLKEVDRQIGLHGPFFNTCGA